MNTPLDISMRSPEIRRAGRLLGGILIGWRLLCGHALAADQSAAIRQAQTWNNLSSLRGLPLSSVANNPPGSDGRVPAIGITATAGQFQTAVPFGGGLAGVPALGKNESGTLVVIQRTARVGSPYLSRTEAFLFGQLIPPPDTDELGAHVPPGTSYWQPKPVTGLPPDNVTNISRESYYWSESAQRIFADRVGPVSVTWVSAFASTSVMPGSLVSLGTIINDSRTVQAYRDGNTGVVYLRDGTDYFPTTTSSFVVSPSPVKPPQKMFWTVGSFSATGKAVSIPTASVKGGVKIAFTEDFADSVPTNKIYRAFGSGGLFDNPTQTNTLWLDGGILQAYNLEGRVLVELLGETPVGGTVPVQLGLEIVDVTKRPEPIDVAVDLGEVLKVSNAGSVARDGSPANIDGSALFPELAGRQGQSAFVYRQHLASENKDRFYAVEETVNFNDVQLHWLIEGEQGVHWPFVVSRYRQAWPSDITHYSHYARPKVDAEDEARMTAVQLPVKNAPSIDYQDALDKPRAKLTSDYKFYTWLDDLHPVHRALIRYNAGNDVSFERVFSWLGPNLAPARLGSLDKDPAIVGLLNWNGGALTGDASTSTDRFLAPRYLSANVNVGDRLPLPDRETNGVAGNGYLAGYVVPSGGTDYSVSAYVDPFVVGFEAANSGAIIPVNARPGHDGLEVLWFRPNGADTVHGFGSVFWPAVIGKYSVRWPSTPDPDNQIVLAANRGSGPLVSLQAKGHVYYQNDSTRPGYNPNEEHALVQGGQVFALRDDLNLLANPTKPDKGYSSSKPCVLLEYTDADGRPSIRAFGVTREGPGAIFDYQIAAGTILQPPMPLPLLEPPLAPPASGQAPVSLNSESARWDIATGTENASSRVVSLKLKDRPLFGAYEAMGIQGKVPKSVSIVHESHLGKLVIHKVTGFVTQGAWFQSFGVDPYANAATGYFSTIKPVTIANGVPLTPGQSKSWRYTLPNGSTAPSGRVAILDPSNRANWLATINSTEPGTVVVTVDASGAGDPNPGTATILVGLSANAESDPKFDDWTLLPVLVPTDVTDQVVQVGYSRFTLSDRKGNVWVARGPNRDGEDPFLTMQFYYRTLPGFHFPTAKVQPPVGTITPYLRPKMPDGTYDDQVLDPVYGNKGGRQVADGNALGIVYRPVWPQVTPVLQMAETLTVPKRGLPAIRGQSSLKVLYQQSAYGPTASAADSVVLHDPTRQKTFSLGPKADAKDVLGKLPPSVKTQPFQGKTYFPNLPPHLANRFYFDPTVGNTQGALVLKGEFVDDLVGDKYLLPSVLSLVDLESLKDLVDSKDDFKQPWYDAINGLRTTLSVHVMNPSAPGTYISSDDPNLNWSIGPTDMANVVDDNVPVDSYALSATGPGTGYVTLVAGNGTAATNPDDPVALEVIRVVKALYPGEVKTVASSNPLAEKLTLQQAIDLAGHPEAYKFVWKIAAPVDGGFPPVHDTTLANLTQSKAINWSAIPFPLASDPASAVEGTRASRVLSVGQIQAVVAVQAIPFASVSYSAETGNYHLTFKDSLSKTLTPGNGIVLSDADGRRLAGTVFATTPANGLVPASADVSVDTQSVIDAGQFVPVSPLSQAIDRSLPQEILFGRLEIPALSADQSYADLWAVLDCDPNLGVKVYLDGQPLLSANTGGGDTVDATPPEDDGFPGGRAFRLGSEWVGEGGASHRIAVELHSKALPGTVQSFQLNFAAHVVTDVTDANGWLTVDSPEQVRLVLGQKADVRSLADNYVIMRYQAAANTHASWVEDGHGANIYWSRWTEPQLAEGYIKRALAGINPFNQRTSDLFDHRVSTDASILTQAGTRYEGDVALNAEGINGYGLIEIYETLLKRGRSLSIDAGSVGINYGPANDALLLAAGYLSDLYMLLGNEAADDAANPTIGIGTKDSTYGNVATALFAFKGEVASLLDEEQALLRGRDDFLQPGVRTAPAYNRLYWNYTRGIGSGEVIYALNYNIQPNPDAPLTGAITASDAQHMYPQGHGDAYGHYLTALTGYYSLWMNDAFDWVPTSEAVTILGKPVAVGYQNERKVAAAAAAVARTGRQIFDLQWRADYLPNRTDGWAVFGTNRTNSARQTVRYWGMDHWATRVGQGAYLNWVMGNSLLPDVDPDPAHEGIQKIDRTTVPELRELPDSYAGLQSDLDNAEAGLTPLGVPSGTVPFDLNPNLVSGGNPTTHFEQVYDRAIGALNNAVVAFDDAKDVTRLMRSEEDSLAALQAQVNAQEAAYNNSLVEIYGTPYSDDMGPGKTYAQDYTGPDYFHYTYVELPESVLYAAEDAIVGNSFNVDVQNLKSPWGTPSLNTVWDPSIVSSADANHYGEGTQYVTFDVGPHGFADKPGGWTGGRRTPGKVQQAISDMIRAQDALRQELYNATGDKLVLDIAVSTFKSQMATQSTLFEDSGEIANSQKAMNKAQAAFNILDGGLRMGANFAAIWGAAYSGAVPQADIFGTANGGDLLFWAREAINVGAAIAQIALLSADFDQFKSFTNDQTSAQNAILDLQTSMNALQLEQTKKEAVNQLVSQFWAVQAHLLNINAKLRAYDDAQRAYQAVLSDGNGIQAERATWRAQTAAVVQGYRTRDAAFRVFRNEKLERYKTLFDLAARYAFMAANAYDYETGLLNTDKGRQYVNRIVSSRALGVVSGGKPQFAGSNTGDPGLSSALAEMKADFDVLKGRLGFNNPDAYGTTVSLRSEKFRIVSGADGDAKWQDVLRSAAMDNILADSDVRRLCLQIDPGDGMPVPGIVLEFGTTIAEGMNLFGLPLAANDHRYSASSFATKIHAVGVALPGYLGMAPGGTGSGFLDPNGLSATPDVYLIPVGTDSMRNPPVGVASSVRTWDVVDAAIPVPFNIGGSDFSTGDAWSSARSLSEPLYADRRHQAFRPVDDASRFLGPIYGAGGTLQRSQYMNSRLIGRSVWNSKWKLVIPADSLLNDPDEGLARFLRSVKDVQLYFQTYSYSGN